MATIEEGDWGVMADGSVYQGENLVIGPLRTMWFGGLEFDDVQQAIKLRLKWEILDAEERRARNPVVQTDAQLLERYRSLAYRIWELFDPKVLGDNPPQFMTAKLEALLDRGFIRAPMMLQQTKARALPPGFSMLPELPKVVCLAQHGVGCWRITSEPQCQALEFAITLWRVNQDRDD